MKLVDKRVGKNEPQFNDIEVGEWFETKPGRTLLKISPIVTRTGQTSVNCIDTKGKPELLTRGTIVTLLNTELVIEDFQDE